MNTTEEKILAKLQRVQRLYERASTSGEKQAAKAAIHRLLERLFSLHRDRLSALDYAFPKFEKTA